MAKTDILVRQSIISLMFWSRKLLKVHNVSLYQCSPMEHILNNNSGQPHSSLGREWSVILAYFCKDLSEHLTPQSSLPLSKKYAGPAEIWTRIAGFRVQSANHYTTGPDLAYGWHEGYPGTELWNQRHTGLCLFCFHIWLQVVIIYQCHIRHSFMFSWW